MSQHVSDQRHRVLFIVPSLARSGAENQVLDLMETLDDRVWCKYLVTFEAGLQQYERVARSNVRYRSLARRSKCDFGLARSIADIIDEEEIVLVHATLSIAVLYAWLARLLSGRKPFLVAAVHTTVNRDIKSDLLGALVYHPVLRRCARIIFVSHKQQAFWERRLPGVRGRSEVVHNGIDLGRYDPSAPDQTLDAGGAGALPQGRTVVCVAAFRPEKGHRILLEAWSRVLRHHSDAVLVLVGDGPERDAIEALVDALGLRASVRFTGAISDVRPVLASASMMVLPSTAVETFSLAALEAMAMQVPVVASDIGGMSEAVITGETGFVIPPGDPAALADAVVRLLGDELLCARLGRQARARVVANFDRRGMAERTHAVLAGLLPRRVQC